MDNRKNRRLVIALALIGLISLSASGQQQRPDTGMTSQQMDQMNKRGDQHMGFDHLKTTHHFLLSSEGGSIQIEANDVKDTASRDQIRQHLRHINMMFSEGNFEVPMLIHEKAPPGTEVMQKLKAEINYHFKETERGAVIQISSRNAEAIQAIHDFLRFQINEHVTGDPLEVKNELIRSRKS